jgi:hypothetical protein
MRATYSFNLILLDLIFLIKFSEEYKLWNCHVIFILICFSWPCSRTPSVSVIPLGWETTKCHTHTKQLRFLIWDRKTEDSEMKGTGSGAILISTLHMPCTSVSHSRAVSWTFWRFVLFRFPLTWPVIPPLGCIRQEGNIYTAQKSVKQCTVQGTV